MQVMIMVIIVIVMIMAIVIVDWAEEVLEDPAGHLLALLTRRFVREAEVNAIVHAGVNHFLPRIREALIRARVLLQESRKAIETNPNNNLAQLRIGQTLNFQLKYEQAMSVLRTIPNDVNPAIAGSEIAWTPLQSREEGGSFALA